MKLLKWIISLFSKKEKEVVIIEEPVKKPIEIVPPSIPSGIKKLALLCGHGAGDSGAICFNKIEEHEYSKKVISLIKDKFPHLEVRTYFKEKTYGWTRVHAQLALFRPDISLELHLNAASGSAIGFEFLITNEASRKFGEQMAASFGAKFGRKIRREKGINFLKSGDRGFLNVYSASKFSKISGIVEPFFCDNKAEWIEPEELAKFYVEFISKQ